jgi:hypothetical protein
LLDSLIAVNTPLTRVASDHLPVLATVRLPVLSTLETVSAPQGA